MEDIKTGILGLGAASTLYYLKRLNEEYNNKPGNGSTYPCILVNSDFNKINKHLPNQFKEIEAAVLPYLKIFEQNKITKLLIPNITIHETIDKILEHSFFGFTIVHPLQLIAEKLLQIGIDSIYLLGTKYTMESGYASGYLAAKGIECIKLSDEIKYIADELRKSIFNNEPINTANAETKLLTLLGDNKTIVLACTELSVLFSAFNTIKYYDMAEEQINYLINIK